MERGPHTHLHLSLDIVGLVFLTSAYNQASFHPQIVHNAQKTFAQHC